MTAPGNVSLQPHQTNDGSGCQPLVLIYVQHLLGTGHIKRALTLANAIRSRGSRACVISGGMATAQTRLDPDLIQLPPLRARDQTFQELIDERDQTIDIEWKNRRSRKLLDHYQQLRPDIVIIESFPFGRRKLRFELLPLLEEIQNHVPRPLVACSVRDIVQHRSDKRIQETIELLDQYFDLVMVHGDPELITFERSFPATKSVRDLIHYTGYVTDAEPAGLVTPSNREVIISGGGGAVGMQLFNTVMEARRLTHRPEIHWRVLVGQNTSVREFELLQGLAVDGISIDRHRTDFRALLANCALSVSQAGYNTILDILGVGVRALLIPFEGEGETEQYLRATQLERKGFVQVLREKHLSPPRLAQEIDNCLSGPAPPPNPFDLDGAAGSARLISRLWKNIEAS